MCVTRKVMDKCTYMYAYTILSKINGCEEKDNSCLARLNLMIVKYTPFFVGEHILTEAKQPMCTCLQKLMVYVILWSFSPK